MKKTRFCEVTCGVHEWMEHEKEIRTKFLLSCAEAGAPDGKEYEVIWLRFNYSGARDNRGELFHRVVCDPMHDFAIQVMLRMKWEVQA